MSDYLSDDETEIKMHAFLGNSELIKFVVPEGVTKIARCAFSGCESLIEVVLPETLKEIALMPLQGVILLKKYVYLTV